MRRDCGFGKIPMEMNEPVPVGHWGQVLSSGFKRPDSAEIKILGVGSIDATTRERGNFGVGSHWERCAADRPWCQETHSF